MKINKEVLKSASKMLKAYTPEVLNGALGYAAFIAPFENLPEEVKIRMYDNLQKAISNHATQSEEESV